MLLLFAASANRLLLTDGSFLLLTDEGHLLLASQPADSVGFIPSTAVVYGPEFTQGPGLIALPLIDSTAIVYGPSFNLATDLGFIASTAVVYGPTNIFQPGGVELGFIGGGAIFGPRLTQTYPAGAPVVSRIIARLFDPSAMDVELAELDLSWGRRWQDTLGDTGAGEVNLQNDDPALPLVDYGSVVRFDLDGQAVFSSVVERLNRHSIAPGDEAEEFTAVSGRGILAMWEDAVIFPSTIRRVHRRYVLNDTRTFSFASLEYDDDSWADATITPANYGKANENYGYPQGFPIPLTAWVWDRNSAGNAPAGDVYLRGNFIFNTADPDLVYDVEIWTAADDAFVFYLDGVKIMEDPGPYAGQVGHITATLVGGTHVFAVRATNLNALKAGSLWTVDIVNPETGEHAILHNSSQTITALGGRPKVLGYPTTVPGFTPGRIIQRLMQEAQSRGALLDWSLTFDGDTDSNGAPWPIIAQVDFQVGMSYLDMLKQLAETYVDIAVAPARLELSAWVIGTRGYVTDTALDRAVNLTSLDHEGVA